MLQSADQKEWISGADMRAMKSVFVVLICLAAAGAAFSAGYAACLVFGPPLPTGASRPAMPAVSLREPAAATTTTTTAGQRPDFGVLWEVWDLLERNFMGDLPSTQKVTYAAIRGVLAEVKDPHTVFVEPPQRQLEKDEHRGRFGGIGVWLYQRESDRSFMLTPMENGPAARAGVREGDRLVRVDQVEIDATKMSRDDVIAIVRGPVGSRVKLGVRREADANEIEFVMQREEFETPSVEWRVLDDMGAADVMYVHLLQFTERTAGEVKEAIAQGKAKGATKLVLDLRDNPGGLLDACLDVASEFLDGGAIMYERKRDGSEQAYAVKAGGAASDIPVVVLVNRGSASASEIVAGALRDRGRARLIGERTYGKGSVQLVFDLSDGSSVHITVARWLTPEHTVIDGAGIEPDQKVALTQEDRTLGRDPQLGAAVLALQTPQR
jgi:carboxyl-terminal processing protease